jgi:hypothetical protein
VHLSCFYNLEKCGLLTSHFNIVDGPPDQISNKCSEVQILYVSLDGIAPFKRFSNLSFPTLISPVSLLIERITRGLMGHRLPNLNLSR